MNEVIAVIIPAYNEEKRIVETLLALKKVKSISQIYVIDDGSTDATVEKVLKIDDIILIASKENKGKGHALKLGVDEAINTSDIIVFADADLKESAEEVTELINPIINDKADVTIAKFPPPIKKGGFGLVKKLAKYGVYLYTGVILDTTLSGQRAFKKEVLQNTSFDYEGYGIELGMTIDILNQGYMIKEIHVNMFHNESQRNIKGFLHRGKQFVHILKVLTRRTSKSLKYGRT
ncbi:MAG: glycosyltransferase family 2 protein [Clostridiaceae bacterium]|nr:glycosyltransferase family 2 protein [Clostridiaceae bacterium]